MRAVLVIDMINEFVTGRLRCERAKGIIPPLKRLLAWARRKGVPVVYVCDAHVPQVDRELRIWGPHALAGTEGSKVIPELEPEEGDYIVKKRRYSGFFGTDLDPLLRELGVSELLLTGIVADVCVQHTAADAFFLGYDLTIVEDCVEAMTEEAKLRAIDYMRTVYGCKVVKSEEVVKE